MGLEHKEKLSFASKEAAQSAVTTANFQYGSKKLKVYLCKKCTQWHIATDHDT
ncbi:hypothetical protein KA529_03045 [Candidatus Saccharibacteria bacterium]|nr:hypothetical protein [Candidatus Saccharibacteria bacterium]